MDLLLPATFQTDDVDAQKNPIRQILERSRRVHGILAGYTRERLHGHLFQSDDEGQPDILILPAKTRTFEGSHPHVLAASLTLSSEENDLRSGRWLRHPLPAIAAGSTTPLEAVIASWRNAFSYVAEDENHGV